MKHDDFRSYRSLRQPNSCLQNNNWPGEKVSYVEVEIIRSYKYKFELWFNSITDNVHPTRRPSK